MKHLVELREALQKELSTLGGKQYSDLTIKCGNDVHYVHKAHVCPQSRVFAAMCNGQFKEAQENEINLPDDDPEAIVATLYWMYTGDYWVSTTSDDGIEEVMRASFSGPDTEYNRLFSDGKRVPHDLINLCLDSKVYALAEKYEVLGLKKAVMSELHPCEPEPFIFVIRDDFMAAIRIAFTTTPERDRELKDWFVGYLSSSFRQLELDAFGDILAEIPGLEREVLLYMHQHEEIEDPEHQVTMLF